MGLSPLQFAKAFERLKTDAATLPAIDLRLLALLDFWPQLEPFARDTAYQTYVDEYFPLVVHHVTDHALLDLSIEELTTVHERLAAMQDIAETDELRQQIELKQRLVLFRLASVLFYAGLIEDALPVCAELAGEKDTPPIDSAELEDLDAFEALRGLTESYAAKQTALSRVLRDIFDRWEAERTCVAHDRINCLFVEKGSHGAASRGRMRQLHGSVEPATSGQETDNISFDNQVKSPDDPFIGAAYDSLKAVRTVLAGSGLTRRRETPYRAYFSIPDSKQTFTGDSIGLAVALVTFTQLLKPELRRQERFIASEVAVTGGLDESGNLNPVNERTLATKIERAFFSPVKYLVLPEGNLAEAKRCVDKLKRSFPRRRLHLLSAQRLSDVVENHNVIRSEKVCMGDFVVRTVVKYSRATKVQVPLLIVMLFALYALICDLFPKAWVGFDWNPEFVQVTEYGIEVLNKDSLFLWSVKCECKEINKKLVWDAGDLNGDGKNEIAFAPSSIGPCDKNAVLYVYDSEGELLFNRSMVQRMPNDEVGDQFEPAHALFQTLNDRCVIITVASRSGPARGHVRIWSRTGDSLVTYVNKGFPGPCLLIDVDSNGEDEMLFSGINNPMACVCLFALGDGPCSGESPPREPGPGPEDVYLLVPPTGVSRQLVEQYNCVLVVSEEAPGRLKVVVCENISQNSRCHLSYYFDKRMRVTSVLAHDSYITQWESFVEQGLLPDESLDSVQERARDNVTYWTDSGWVTESDLRAIEKR